MSKMSLAAVSLVAAVPAGYLGWLLVDGFLHHIDKMPMMLQVMAVVTLLVCVSAVLLPPGVLVFGPKPAGAPAKKSKKAKDEAEAIDEGDEAEAVEAGGESAEIEDTGEVVAADDDIEEMGIVADDDAVEDLGGDLEMEEEVEDLGEIEEIEEDEPPKKRKK